MAIKARPAWTLYQDTGNGGSGYTVLSMKFIEATNPSECVDMRKNSKFTAVGSFLPTQQDIVLVLEGQWVEDKKHGKQFRVTNFTEEIESTRSGIVNYLSCGVIKGIGKVIATRIYDKFGEQTLDIMDNNIDRLLEVRGISPKKLEKIKDSYVSSRGARPIISFLAPFGISPWHAKEVAKRYSLDDIKENPYSLADVRRIGFPTADIVAKKIDFPMTNYKRLVSALDYVLQKNEQNGSLGMNGNELIKKTAKVLNQSEITVTEKQVYEALYFNQTEGEKSNFLNIGGYIYRKKIYFAECDVASAIYRLASSKARPIEKLEEKVTEWEKENQIFFDEIQKKAITTALSSGFSVITGGPGRGKTTVAKAIVDIRKKYGHKGSIRLLAPTGRAARRLEELTGESASTIHSALSIYGETEEYEAEKNLIEEEQVLVDETSMIDVYTTKALLMSVSDTSNVTFIGDIDQLPSVGPGAILRDVIKCGCVPVVQLENVYRQGNGSTIVTNSVSINNGNNKLEYNSTDFMMYPINETLTSAKTLIHLYKSAVESYGWENVALLSPYHHADSKTSTDFLNRNLQQILNPPLASKPEMKYRNQIFRLGDTVMNIKNGDGVSNGDVGKICYVDKETVSVKYQDGKVVDYEDEDLENLELAYAISIHKSQGSEYKCVIISLMDEHRIMLKRNLLYTAVTRASKEVHIVGQLSAVNKAIATKDTSLRKTLLCEKLQQLFKYSNQSS